MFPKKLSPRQAGFHDPGQRMAEVGRGQAVAAEKLLFERKYAEHVAQRLAHTLQTALAPGPHLRRHQVHHRNALAVQLSRQAEVEIGGIRQDGQFRPEAPRGGQQLAVFAVDAGNVRNHLHQADHGQAGGIDHGFDAGAAHARTGAAEQVRLGPDSVDLLRQKGGVQIARSFARRYQNVPEHLT